MNPDRLLQGKAGIALVFVSIGLPFYWMFTYSGPYRYLAELQIKWFGQYVPKLTLMVIMLLLLGIAAAIRLVFRGAERPVPQAAQGNTGVAPNGGTATANSATYDPIRYARFAAPVIVLGLGGWTYLNGVRAGNLQPLTAADFEDGRVSSSVVYTEVRGHLDRQYMSKDHYFYIPMMEQWSMSGPVRVLVGVDENKAKTLLRPAGDGKYTVRGVADKSLEGDVKYAFEKNGIPVAGSCWVIHAGREPADDRTFGVVMMGVAAVLAALFAVLENYRKRKAVTRQAAQTLP